MPAVYENSLTISGNLGKEPEKIETRNGGAFYKASIANTWFTKKTQTAKTFWIDVIAFGDAGQMLKGLPKGSKIVVTGRLDVTRGETREGKQFTSVSVLANEINIVERAVDSSPKPVDIPQGDVDFDDIPF